MVLKADYSHPLAVSTVRGRKRNMSGIRHQVWTNPATLDANGYLTALAGPNAATLDVTLDGALVTDGVGIADFARNVVITVTHASAVVVSNGVITGTDINGQPITEAWNVTAGTTSKTFTGTKGFLRVTGLTIISASDATTNTNIAGTGDILGLDTECSSVVFVAEEEDGVAPTAGVIVAGDAAATADARGSYDPNSALNGALDFDLWYITDNPQNSD